MSDVAHKDRQHAVCSASAMAKNMVCAGNIALSSLCEDVEREAAAFGTCTHQLSEKCLLSGPEGGEVNADSFIGLVQRSGKFEFPVDEDMANTAQVYVDYCRSRLAEYKAETGDEAVYWVEQKLSLESLMPALETGGPGDFIIWFPKWMLVEIIDLKAGRGVTVNVAGSPQGRTYGIGAMLSLPEVRPEWVMVTIVQPRVGDGLPKSEKFHVSELFDWCHDLLGLIQKCKDALDEFNALGGNSVLFDEWADKWLTPGQCTFCTAKPICPALRKKALAAMPALARQWHEDVTLTTPPTLSNLAKIGSPEELAHDLDGFDELEAWISARRAYAHAQAEAGVEVPGYQLVEKIGNRKWSDETKATETLAALGLTEKQMFKASLVTPAQAEKLLGKRKTEIAPLTERPVRGTNLVAANKTTRPKVQSKAEAFHEDVETEK